MSSMNRRYFKMDKDNSAELELRYDDLRKPRQDACNALAAKYGADGVLITDGSQLFPSRIMGLMFEVRPENQDGLKFEMVEVRGHTKWKASPDRRYKAGKALAADIRAAEKVAGAETFSRWAVEETGMANEGHTDGKIHLSVAGMAKGCLVVSVPSPEGGSFPEIDPRLTEIKKSEFIALTEE